jgi:hypothetical protein
MGNHVVIVVDFAFPALAKDGPNNVMAVAAGEVRVACTQRR